MTRLNGLHILLTYRCLSACDPCFVWGSPDQTGVFTLKSLYRVLDQAGGQHLRARFEALAPDTMYGVGLT